MFRPRCQDFIRWARACYEHCKRQIWRTVFRIAVFDFFELLNGKVSAGISFMMQQHSSAWIATVESIIILRG